MTLAKLPALAIIVPLLGLVACTVMTPNEPSVMVLPGSGKTFDQFRADNEVCKRFADEQVNRQTPDGVAADSGVRSAAVGTLLGAAAGAAMNGGRGASTGAGAGFALGGLAGTGAADTSASRLQQRYDVGYQQCMYANGHRLPASGGLMGYFFRDSHERGARAPLPSPPGAALR